MEYNISDIIVLSLSGLGGTIAMGTLNWALRYEKASRLAAIAYTENVLTILFDIFVFNYQFVLTDCIGIGLIAAWIMALTVTKILKEDKD